MDKLRRKGCLYRKIAELSNPVYDFELVALLQETIIATAKSKYKVKSLHTYADKINRVLSCLATEKDFSVSYMEVVFYDGIKWHIFI